MFSRDWCTRVLRDYRWGADSQAQFLGNMLMTFDGGIWLKNVETLKPLLHSDVDVALLAAVCGLSPEHYGPIADTEDIKLLYSTVQQTSQYCRGSRWGTRRNNPPKELSITGGHPGLNIVVELAPPTRHMELYRNALSVKNSKLGIGQVDTLALPDMGP